MTDEEWRVRIELAGLCRLVALYGWDDMLDTHITARVPGAGHHFLINAYGLMFEEITASNLIKVDVAGQPLNSAAAAINPAGFVIHSAIHKARPDVNFVIHLHTIAGVAVSCQQTGLLPLNQTALSVYSELAYHDYEGIVADAEEQARLVADLGQSNALMLRHHGTLACGPNAGGAWQKIYRLERACSIQVAATNLSTDGLLPLSADIIRQPRVGSTTESLRARGDSIWPAMVRKLDRVDPSYKL